MSLYLIQNTLLSQFPPKENVPYVLLDIPSEAQHIVIPDGVTHIGERALFCRSALRCLTIPASVIHFGESAFGFCVNLSAISLHPHHFDLLDDPKCSHSIFDNCTRIHCVAPIDRIPEHLRLDACAGFAKFQSDYPPEIHSGYIDYLRRLMASIFDGSDEYFPVIFIDECYLFETVFDTPEMIPLLCSERLLSDAASQAFLDEARAQQNIEACAVLLDYRCTLDRPKNSLSLDEP